MDSDFEINGTVKSKVSELFIALLLLFALQLQLNIIYDRNTGNLKLIYLRALHRFLDDRTAYKRMCVPIDCLMQKSPQR